MGYLKRFFKLGSYEKRRMLSMFFKSPFQKIGFKKYGKRTYLYKPALIVGKKYISLGLSVSFRQNARLEAIDVWGDGEMEQHFIPEITIGDHTSFQSDAHITSAGKLTIGSGCVFLSRCLITNIGHSYEQIDKSMMSQPLIVKEVVIGNNCFFGMDSKVFPGVHIGDNVIVGANTIVMKDVPSYSVVVGCPARIIKKYNFGTKKWDKVD
jgi:acetyltransferase-like isoleucine patch superfamily enzyme